MARSGDDVAGGGSGVAAIRGEPGIGKSRLMDALREQVIAEEGSALPFRCSTFQATTHLYPARRLVAEMCGIDLAADLAGAGPRLRETLAQAGLEHHLPLFGALLGIPPGPECPAPELDGQRLREATLAALVEWIEGEAARSPRALMVDDLQWADPSTLELLDRLIARRVPRLLVLLTSRVEFELPWTSIEVLDLGPLSAADLDRIAAASPAAQRLAAGQVEKLVRRSDGVPLFFEELLRVEGQPSGTPAPRLDQKADGDPAGAARSRCSPGSRRRGSTSASSRRLPASARRSATTCSRRWWTFPMRSSEWASTGSLRRVSSIGTRANRRPTGFVTTCSVSWRTTPSSRRRGYSATRGSRTSLRQRLGGDQSADAGRLAQHLEHAGRDSEAIAAYVEAAQIAQSQGAFAEATEILDHALELVAADRRRAGATDA